MTKPQSIKSPDSERQREDFDSRAPLGETILRRLYSYMLKCRTVEERIRLLFRQGRFSGNYFAAVGQEATEVGVTMDLLADDTIAPSHRNFVTHIMKGTPLTLMFAHIFLRKDSPDQGRCAQAHCGYAPLNIITLRWRFRRVNINRRPIEVAAHGERTDEARYSGAIASDVGTDGSIDEEKGRTNVERDC